MIADHETALIGPITDSIIDADRIVREEYGDEFPNFEVYRLILCGERIHLKEVRQWWVGFCHAFATQTLRKKPSDEVICFAAWDSLQRLMNPLDAVLTDDYVAGELGCDDDSYRILRKAFEVILSRSMQNYWDKLLIAYAKVKRHERRLTMQEIGLG